MPQPFVNEVMESMGWTDGSYIPIANAENKKLLDHVNKLIKSKAEKENSLEIVDARLEKLTNHYKNSEQDIAQNLNLINAHRSQLTTESHFFKLAEHESSRLKQQIKEVDKEKEELSKYEDTTNNEIKKINKNIEKLSDKLNWTKTALTEWKQAMAKGDETNNLIQKYCKEDQNKAESLEVRRRTVQDTINKQRKILIDLYQEQKSLEQVLQRTAELYRQSHMERRHMVETWKDAVNQMNQRESDISATEKDLEDAKKISRQKNQKLQEQIEFLDQQKVNNKEVERTIYNLNENSSILKKRLMDINESVTSKEMEVNATRRSLQALAQKLQQKRQQNRQIELKKTEKLQQIQNFEKQLENLDKRYENFQNESMSSQDRLKQLDELKETEDKAKHQLEQEIERLNSILYKSQQQLSKMKDEEKTITTQNKGAEITIQGIRNSIRDYEKEVHRKTEMDYNLGFKIQQLEMRIGKIQGKDIDFDPEKEKRLLSLENSNTERSTELVLLQGLVVEIEHDIRKLTLNYNNELNEIEKMNFKIKERQLYCEGGEKKLKSTIMENQEKIVELSILKMRVNQMENQLEKHESKLYTLEKHKLELDLLMKERLMEIKIKYDLLALKRKHLLDERGTLKADIGERYIKIQNMKKRYELAIELLGKNEDGTLVTATQLKIETAQEKQMLLEEGNQLNENVLRAEDDIKAMENTLCLLNYSNDSYRKTFDKSDEQNPALDELNTLQEEYCKALAHSKNLRSNLTMRSKDIEEISDKRHELDRELDELNRNRIEKNDVLMKIHKELLDQKTKIQRAERELKCAQKAIRQRCFDKDFYIQFEKELDLCELEERNTTGLQLLADLVEISADLAPIISSLLYEKGMKIPHANRSTKSQSSYRSEYSDRSCSETSLRLFGSSSSGGSSSSSSRQHIKASSSSTTLPSVVSIDFPVNENIKESKATKATKKTSQRKKS